MLLVVQAIERRQKIMIENEKPNPFQVLRLPTNAGVREVREREQEMDDEAETEEARQLCRWAVEQLRTNPYTRLEYEVFEIPDTHYENPGWDDFVKRYKINPVDKETLSRAASPLRLEDFNLVALIQLLLDGLLTIPEADIAVAVDDPPFSPGYGPPPLEVRDVIFG